MSPEAINLQREEQDPPEYTDNTKTDVWNLANFGLIPCVFFYLHTVGKPAILGQKLTCRYFVRRDCIEVDVDVGSFCIAMYHIDLESIVKIVKQVLDYNKPTAATKE
ncbi:hypothetical protein Pelo_19655 [Pelomyxa schiedti]|nr:hypothetical protein Pelo_19655 [Pelomyxa schiedti]